MLAQFQQQNGPYRHAKAKCCSRNADAQCSMRRKIQAALSMDVEHQGEHVVLDCRPEQVKDLAASWPASLQAWAWQGWHSHVHVLPPAEVWPAGWLKVQLQFLWLACCAALIRAEDFTALARNVFCWMA